MIPLSMWTRSARSWTIALDVAGDGLRGVARLAIDTAPVIYFVEAHPRYDALVTEVFRRISRRALVGITSLITLTEVLVQPYRRGAIGLQQQYRDLPHHSANVELVGIDHAAADQAAELRARHNLRTPDALQVAVALASDCQALLTNDRTLKRVVELRVLVLDELTV